MRYFMGILIFAVLSYPASIPGQPTLSVREGLNLGLFQYGADLAFNSMVTMCKRVLMTSISS